MANELAIFQERIRKVWYENEWWFSVVDVVGVLTDSANPRRYWTDMKRRIADEGFAELYAKCRLLKLRSSDGKFYSTACADFVTIISLIHSLPAEKRHKRGENGNANRMPVYVGHPGIYVIVNTLTQEEYIGSTYDIAKRFRQHRALLRRGKHHAIQLQEAWNIYGEAAFRFLTLEEVANIASLEAIEQKYLEERRPAYNSTPIAQNVLSLPPISPERLQQMLIFLYDLCGTSIKNPLFHMLRDAVIYGFVKPGPNFHLLVQAATSNLTTWEAMNAYQQQAS